MTARDMLRNLLFLAVLVTSTALLSAVAIVGGAVAPRSTFVMGVGRTWSRIMVWASGARVRYLGLEHAAPGRACIFACNHQSNLDIWVLAPKLPRQARFVAKKELFEVPLFGGALRAGGFIPIDRANRGDAIKSLSRAREALARGDSVILFPEGTRSRSGTLQPFKKGAFHLALAAGVPIVPVSVAGSWDVMPRTTWSIRPGPVEVRFGEPIDPRPFAPDRHDALRERVRDTIAAQLAARSAPGDAPPRADGNARS